MSVDGCKFTSTSSILLKKVRHTNNVKNNSNIEVQVKKSQSTSSFSRLQSVGLSLVTSVTKKRSIGSNKDVNNSSDKNRTASRTSTKTTSITATTATTPTAATTTRTTQNEKRFDKLNKHVSSNSLPSIEELELPKPSPTPTPPPTRLKPSISARPFSQFFFPTRDEEVISNNFDKKGMGHLINEREPLPQQTQPDKQKQQQQQQKLRARQQIESSKRHSIAIDFAAADDSSPNSTTSSRSSSLKTVRNCSIVDNVVIATNDTTVGIQSEINFATGTTIKKRNLSRTPSQQQQQQVNRLSGVARARTVLGLDSLRSREMRAISLWKDTVSQLSLDESMMYGESNIIGEEDEEDDNDGNDGLIEILSHPALIVNVFPKKFLNPHIYVCRLFVFNMYICTLLRCSRNKLWSDNGLYDDPPQKS